MTFDPELFRKQMEDALNIAEGVKTPTVVKAHVRKQAGEEILVAQCPHCHEVAALSGEGKHLCRRCGSWLEYKREG